MVMFTLKYWRLGNVYGRDRETVKRQCREELAKIKAVAETLKGQEVVETEHLGRRWVVGGVPGVRREALRWISLASRGSALRMKQFQPLKFCLSASPSLG